MFKRNLLTITEIILNIVEALLILRIILKLLGANVAAPFVDWIYRTSSPLLSPFEGMFPTSELGSGFVLEISALFAVLIYAFLGSLLETAILRLTPLQLPSQPENKVNDLKSHKRK